MGVFLRIAHPQARRRDVFPAGDRTVGAIPCGRLAGNRRGNVAHPQARRRDVFPAGDRTVGAIPCGAWRGTAEGIVARHDARRHESRRTPTRPAGDRTVGASLVGAWRGTAEGIVARHDARRHKSRRTPTRPAGGVATRDRPYGLPLRGRRDVRGSWRHAREDPHLNLPPRTGEEVGGDGAAGRVGIASLRGW